MSWGVDVDWAVVLMVTLGTASVCCALLVLLECAAGQGEEEEPLVDYSRQ